MANHKHRDIRYKGFIIGLDYDPGDYECLAPGWVYSIVNDTTGLDHGSSSSRLPFHDSVREAQETVNKIINEVDNCVEEQAEFSGDDEDYLREDDDPCAI